MPCPREAGGHLDRVVIFPEEPRSVQRHPRFPDSRLPAAISNGGGALPTRIQRTLVLSERAERILLIWGKAVFLAQRRGEETD